MRVLVTGSSGHLGEALCHTLRTEGQEVTGLDRIDGSETDVIGSIVDRSLVGRSVSGVDAVVHTATLHKPHLATHSRQEFLDTNLTGTLNLLEEAATAGVGCFVFTSTTSLFGHAMVPRLGGPATWIDEDVTPRPKNIYGATKRAAEDLCELFRLDRGLPCVILRTARFFPEPDDQADLRVAYDDANIKLNELLYRRVDLEDVVSAHLRALERAPSIGFGRYVISATTPFTRDDLDELQRDAAHVVRQKFPECEPLYERLGWRLFPTIDRVYVNDRARTELGWSPHHDFGSVIARLHAGGDPRSPLAITVGQKGYHDRTTFPYTVR